MALPPISEDSEYSQSEGSSHSRNTSGSNQMTPPELIMSTNGAFGVVKLEPFDAAEDDYRYLRLRAAELCKKFNDQPFTTSAEERRKAWNEIVNPGAGMGQTELLDYPQIKGPITIDYGLQLLIDPSCFLNRGCFIGDNPDSPVTIGANTILGPGVTINSVTHPTDWRERRGRHGPSLAGPVTIGEDCYIGSNVVILPGTTIGEGCVIGASSVVTHSIPAYHVAVGNPARPIRKVAADVPDAPGLFYERQDDRVVVMRREYAKTPVREAMSNGALPYFERAAQAESAILKMLNPSGDRPTLTDVVHQGWKRTLFDVGMLLIAALIGWWTVHQLLH